MHLKLNLQKTPAAPIIAGHIGTVIDVIAGHIPPALSKQRFSANQFQYGFEIGSPHTQQSLGETVLVNGYCYTRSTDHNSPHYFKTIAGQDFVSSGIFLIPKGAKPTHLVEKIFTTACPLDEFCEALFAEIKQPFAFAGFFQFSQLHATAIAKPPIHEKNIFENESTYYPFTPQILTNITAFVVGAMADYSAAQQQPLLKQLQTVLYHNPFDEKSRITTHAHGITLTQSIHAPEEITPDIVDQTWHVFSEQSLLKAVKSEIFIIKAMRDFSSDGSNSS